MTTETVTYDEYSRARDALDALVRERAPVLERGLDALRQWLAAGAGERWLHYEAVVQRAREQDLALAMWFEAQWHGERNQRRRAEEKARRRAEPAPAAETGGPAKGAGNRDRQTAAPLEKSHPGGGQRPAPTAQARPTPKSPAATPARSFGPAGAVWRRP